MTGWWLVGDWLVVWNLFLFMGILDYGGKFIIPTDDVSYFSVGIPRTGWNSQTISIQKQPPSPPKFNVNVCSCSLSGTSHNGQRHQTLNITLALKHWDFVLQVLNILSSYYGVNLWDLILFIFLVVHTYPTKCVFPCFSWICWTSEKGYGQLLGNVKNVAEDIF